MTPAPALWDWGSRGFISGGASKKRRKNGSSSRGFRWPGSSLMVPRVAMLTTAGETRLTMGASEGIGAASAMSAAPVAAYKGLGIITAGPAMMAAASAAAAKLRRRFMPVLPFDLFSASETRPDVSVRPRDRHHRPRYYTEDCARRTLLGGFHRDPVRLHLRQLRNCDFQHTVDELRLDVLGIGRIRQAATALECGGNALYAAIAFARFSARVL